MFYVADRIVMFIDAPRASGCYLVEAANDEATKVRLDSEAQDAAETLREVGQDWTADDVAKGLESKGWTITWLDLIKVAL